MKPGPDLLVRTQAPMTQGWVLGQNRAGDSHTAGRTRATSRTPVNWQPPVDCNSTVLRFASDYVHVLTESLWFQVHFLFCLPQTFDRFDCFRRRVTADGNQNI